MLQSYLSEFLIMPREWNGCRLTNSYNYKLRIWNNIRELTFDDVKDRLGNSLIHLNLRIGVSGVISREIVIGSVLVEVNLKLNYISFCAIDIDECSNNTDNCDVNAFCNNTMGSHNCTCNPGYTGNGTWCTGKIRHLLTSQILLN